MIDFRMTGTTGPGSPKCFGGASAGDLTSVTCRNDPHGKPETLFLWVLLLGVWSGNILGVDNLGTRARVLCH